ncbi:MMPL family transporter [Paraglaciecola hydrolytica]|uniref:Membrane transport protein MMPL domain-containing protein n=1 Tax=Paraglaciecola hydrolytica TaxID=1799789 RepID=A0A136A261_9ALTE|nr:MMPL family transporter [Paraglaciecola hydrolytica]KXI29338.1 hypothetical protein AX660_14445 [Paraglaciecola hydrolytica]
MFNLTQTRLQYTWVVVTILLISVLIYNALQRSIKFDADILNLLDIGDNAGLLTKVASEPFQNKALLLIQHSDQQQAKTYLRQIHSAIVKLHVSEQISLNPSDKLDIQALVATYSDYPLAFLSNDGQAARANNNYGFIISRYMQMLSQPSNPLVSLSINKAPLLNLADWFSARLHNSQWKKDDNLLYIEQAGQRYYPLFMELKSSAVQLDQVVSTVALIEQVLQQHQPSPSVTIIKSGLLFHSAAVTQRAQFEMQLFSVISLIGVLLLTLISFRSLRPLIGIVLLISASMLAGMAALVLIFAKIHLLSLVFAISLIGIAVDYGYHILFTAKYTGKNGAELAKHITPALLMGAGTTLLSYLLLLLLPIPLLQQVAVFVGAGLIFAIFTGLTVISSWSAKNVTVSPLIKHPRTSNKMFSLVLGVMFVCSIAAVTQWHFEDNINIFNSTPQTLIDDEIKVSKLVGNLQYPRFISVSGKDQQQVLQRFEKVRHTLNTLSNAEYELRGIDQWLPPITTQQANEQWLISGIEDGQLSPIVGLLSNNTVNMLHTRPKSWMTADKLPTFIQQLYPAFIEHADETVGILSYMGPLDERLYAQLQSQLEFEINYYDKPAQYSAALSKLRHYILYFLAMAVVALLLLMTLRYGWRKGLILGMFPLLTAFSALAITVLISSYVTIFNLLACILILALNVDYVVFLKEHGKVNYVLKSILLSAATSALAFGMMVFSNTPAIWQFGLTVLLGVSLGWLLCHFMPSTLLTQKEAQA